VRYARVDSKHLRTTAVEIRLGSGLRLVVLFGSVARGRRGAECCGGDVVNRFESWKLFGGPRIHDIGTPGGPSERPEYRAAIGGVALLLSSTMAGVARR